MASTLQQPAPLVEPFANSGDRNTIPQAATGTQKASLTEGFPPVTQLPIDRGGIPPERQDFNALGYLTTSQYFFLQNGGRFTFNPTVSAAIGGYPAGATLWYNDTARGVWYPVTSVINNNTYNFVQYPTYIDGTKWKRAVDAFPTTQITNCITEIPQDIKLELNNGTLTLKAGSKIYLANGTLGDTYTTTADISETNTSNGVYLAILSAQDNIYIANITSCLSGTIANRPTSLSTSTGLYFATDENKIYLTDDRGANWYTGSHYSLPIAIITISNGAISSIDQVFNGFGYIGSNAFVLPGVKGLAPNGINSEGTYNNKEIITSKVYISPIFNDTQLVRSLTLLETGLGYFTGGYETLDTLPTSAPTPLTKRVFIPRDNRFYTWSNGKFVPESYGAIIIGNVATSAGKITSLNTLLPFRAADYNDIVRLEQRIQVAHGSLPAASNIVPGRIYFVTE